MQRSQAQQTQKDSTLSSWDGGAGRPVRKATVVPFPLPDLSRRSLSSEWDHKEELKALDPEDQNTIYWKRQKNERKD